MPWSGPLLAPALVSSTMIAAGVVYVWRQSSGHPMRLRGVHWMGAHAAGALILAALVVDTRGVTAGELSKPFPWPLFACGEVLGVMAFVHALYARE